MATPYRLGICAGGHKKEFPIRLSVRYRPLSPGFAWRNEIVNEANPHGRLVVATLGVGCHLDPGPSF
jgi:hypothetical protein